MEEINVILREYVQRRLSAAPESVAKAELVEELTENLCCRYQDLIAGGADPDQARERAMDSLGETEELVEYLSQLPPDEPLPEPMAGDIEDNLQLDALWKNVEGILRGVAHKARNIARSAKETVEESGVWSSKTESEETEESKEPKEPRDSKGWEFSVGYDKDGKFRAEAGSHSFQVDSEEIKTVVKDAMKEVKKAMKEAGHVMKDAMDTAGEAVQDAYHEVMSNQETPVQADAPIEGETLRGIEVRTGSGDITIRFSQDPDSDVLVDGDIEKLEVFRTNDGVLNIRPVQTAASSFLFGRGLASGMSSADVILDLPARFWDFLRITTGSGDVELEGNTGVGFIELKTMSGDVEANLAHCDLLQCKTTSGDINWWGQTDDLHVETVSGDLDYQGNAARVWLKSVSGELEFRGSANEAHVESVSGDVTVHSDVQPEDLAVNTTSGEVSLRIPDNGPFKVNFRTTSGEFRSNFFAGHMTGRDNTFAYEGGGEKLYRVATVSGDLTMKKY